MWRPSLLYTRRELAAAMVTKQRRPRGPSESGDPTAAGLTTSPSSSDGESDRAVAVVAQPQKKYKATYYQRRDEIEELQQQVEALQRELERTKREARRNPWHDRAVLTAGIECSALVYAGTMAATATYSRTMGSLPSTVPLNTFIHLPVDVAERRDVLRQMREHNLYAGRQFMMERTRCMDLGLPHQQTEKFELPGGDATSSSLQVEQFSGGYSLRQVYDTFLYFMSNQEIAISERLGILTIRENDDMDDSTQGQNRLVSSIPGGLEVEMNVALFAGYFEATETEPAYAQIVVNYVDEDERYPNQPETRGRKEVNCAITLSEVPTANGSVVAMARWSHVHFRAPGNPMTRAQHTAVRNATAELCMFMSTVIRERLELAALETRGTSR